jgi:hypothetical protein
MTYPRLKEYSTSPKKEFTDTGCFYKTSFGRISDYAENSGLPRVSNFRDAAIL